MVSLLWQSSHGALDQEHLTFLKKEENSLDCGTLTEASEVQGRVINGRPVEHRYPWLFNVFHSRDRWDQTHSTTGRKITGSVGSLITRTAVVTCGHCICDSADEPETVYACERYNPSSREKNYNVPRNHQDLEKPHGNEIMAMFSNNRGHDLSPAYFDHNYDRKLRAYVYMYQNVSGWRVFSANGDAGIIFLPEYAIGDNPRARPICLPHPTLLKRKKKLKVKVAGPGNRYDETGITWKTTNTSCITNNAMKKNTNSPQIQHAFLPCKKYDTLNPDHTYCLKVTKRMCNENYHMHTWRTLSTSMEVKFHTLALGHPFPNKVSRTAEVVFNRLAHEKCDELWPRMEEAVLSEYFACL